MPLFSESFLEKHYDDFFWFNPGCVDKRIREINMRTKYCNHCKGLENCKMHPQFWLEGEANRLQVNEGYLLEEVAEAAE